MIGTGLLNGSGWRLLAGELVAHRRSASFLVAWSFVSAIPTLVSGLVIAAALDAGFLHGHILAGVGWLALFAATMGLRVLALRRVFPHLASIVEPLRDGLVRAVVSGTLRRHAADGLRPDLAGVARLSEQVEAVRQLVGQLLRSVAQTGMTVVAALVGLAVLAPQTAGLVLAPVLVSLALFAAMLTAMRARQRATLLAEEEVARRSGQYLAGLRDIMACGAQDRATAAVAEAVQVSARAQMAAARLSVLRGLVLAIGARSPVLVVLLVGGHLVSRGQLSAGQLVGAATYVNLHLTMAVYALTGTVGGLWVPLAVTLERLAEASHSPPSRVRPAGRTPVGYELTARRLTFAYGPQAEPIVANLNLTVPYGEHLAVVGPSGVGKSTLAQLLTGLTSPQRGQVRVGGATVDSMDEMGLRRMVALIPQEAYVFAGTLRDNLGYLAADVDDEAIAASAVAVGASELIDRLGGVAADIDPSTLSAGERQLIALTRVHLSSARIVILDEATCHLDPAAESRAEQALSARDGTLIVIAHRISSAIRADRILLMDGATPILGTHRDLLDTSPLYADLVGHWEYVPV